MNLLRCKKIYTGVASYRSSTTNSQTISYKDTECPQLNDSTLNLPKDDSIVQNIIQNILVKSCGGHNKGMGICLTEKKIVQNLTSRTHFLPNCTVSIQLPYFTNFITFKHVLNNGHHFRGHLDT